LFTAVNVEVIEGPVYCSVSSTSPVWWNETSPLQSVTWGKFGMKKLFAEKEREKKRELTYAASFSGLLV
jgi:hypothetical protein